MDVETIVMLIVAAAAAVMAGVGLYIARKPATVGAILDATEDGLSDIERAAGAAKEYVLAAEQLWQTGRLEKESRLYFVVQRLSAAFPDIAESTLEDSVEAAVAWMKMAEGKLVGSEG